MAQCGQERPNRRSIRLSDYDYSKPGLYFVTICSKGRNCLFGDVIGGEMRLSPFGQIVEQEWLLTPSLRPNVELDAFVAMPDHLHGIIGLTAVGTAGTRRAVSLRSDGSVFRQFGKPVPGSLATVIRSFKSAVTKRVNETRGTSGVAVWQPNHYEHIIRNDETLNRAREYIASNPLKWELDRSHPANAPEW